MSDFRSPVVGLDVTELPARLRAAMEAAQATLPKNAGVALFVFDFGEGGGMGYISNGARGEVIEALLEWITHQMAEQG